MLTRTRKAAELMLEMGKLINEARGEVKFSATFWPTTPRTANVSWRPEARSDPRNAHMESSPIGVIFCVEPWNFPLSISWLESPVRTHGG
jgi:succinate-semialdehyde dehydrogenase / glutarate-semialdehyde dehydrogenase